MMAVMMTHNIATEVLPMSASWIDWVGHWYHDLAVDRASGAGWANQDIAWPLLFNLNDMVHGTIVNEHFA